MITVIDYGMGNLGSILNVFKKIGVQAVATKDRDLIRQATKLVLPGVGAFDAGMQNLERLDLIGVLQERVIERQVPLLGVCLGMQLLGQGSEEGKDRGLSWIEARSVRFNFPQGSPLKVPHMGWAYTHPTQETELFRDMPEKARFYFVHSYHVVCSDPSHVIATATHGITFCAAVRLRNIWGVQFHPEKSHKYGMQLCRNFADIKE